MSHKFRFAGVALAAVLVVLSSASSAGADPVLVSFSGGGGTPLTVTLPQPVAFAVTNDTASTGAVFLFQDVGGVLGGTVRAATGNVNYTVNAGGPTAIDNVGSFNLGLIDLTDVALFKNSDSVNLSLGDVVLLSAGSVTTTTNVSAAAPPSGLYNAILVDNNGTQLAVGVPEPTALGLLALAAIPALRRRR